MKKIALMLAVVMALGMALTACGGAASSAPAASGATSTATSAPAEATGAKEIVVNLVQEPPEMNSILTTSTGSMNVMRHIMDGLVALDQTDNPIPAIAEKWDISEDSMTYTFHLRKDAKWTNGDPVVAKDFMFAWNQLFTAETASDYASSWAAYIKGAEQMLADGTPAEGVGYKAIDDYTIELNLTRPCAYILSVLAFPNFLPVNEKAYTEAGGRDAYGTEAEFFCTNGPFKVTAWEHESDFIVEKNPDYYAADTIKLDKIDFTMINDSTTAYNSYVAGDLDLNELNGDKLAMATAAGYETGSYDDASCWYFEFNTTIKGLDNAKIRKAITMGVDVESFVKNVVKNNSTVSYAYTPPAINGGKFNEAVGKVLDREGYAADNYKKAKELFEEGLKEAGMTAADFKISLVVDDTDTAAKYAAFFQEQLKTNLGLDIAVEQMTYKARLQQMSEKTFNGIVMAGWGPDYNDPMTFLDLWITGGGNNHTSWSNAEYDAFVEAAQAEADPAAREKILIDAENLLLEEMPVGPLYNRRKDYCTSERLVDVCRTGFQDMNLRWADVVA
ncbi:MAG: peptide ABC transporter substrate-binding protein [Ruthenibacterium sp.]